MTDPDAEKINALHAECFSAMRNTVEKAIVIGELLFAKKDECKHGEWLPWIKANLQFDRRTAGKYMSCFEKREELPNCPLTGNLTIEEFSKNKAKSRPKPKPDVAPKPHPRHDEMVALHDGGRTYEQISAELGIGARQVRHSVEREKIVRNVMPEVTPEMLSMTAQQKLETAIRQHKEKLSAQYRVDVVAASFTHLAETIGPRLKEEQDIARREMERRRGIMSKSTYRKIWSCLHPDWVTDPEQKERYADAFRLFSGMEKLLLDEKESPTAFVSIPRTAAEWEEKKRQVQAAKKARRDAAKNGEIQSRS